MKLLEDHQGDLELSLIAKNVLPGDPFDIPVMIQDRRFNSDGTIFYDPLDHNGYLGDVYCVNGKAFPKLHVQRRKYRFRFLNGCNARHIELRLSDSRSFLGLGTDSWLYPEAIVRETLLMSPAKRADVIIDFTNAPSELYLENILRQEDGRGPGGKLDDRDLQIPGTQVLKFVVEGPPQRGSATVVAGTPLRPHVPPPAVGASPQQQHGPQQPSALTGQTAHTTAHSTQHRLGWYF